MSLVVWRFCLDGVARSAAEAFSGDGSAQDGGRWNRAGARVVYCAASQAVALLETLVDLPQGEMPRLVLFRAEIPEGIACEHVARADLPERWRETPAPEPLREIGNRWLSARRAAILFVPSAIVPDEPNVLISPDHRDFRRIVTSGPFPFEIDPRLVR